MPAGHMSPAPSASRKRRTRHAKAHPPSNTYPRGVSSYLTTFLNDASSTEHESGSESDDSFFSYSARRHSPSPRLPLQDQSLYSDTRSCSPASELSNFSSRASPLHDKPYAIRSPELSATMSYSFETPPPRQYTPPSKSSPATSPRKLPQKNPSKPRYRRSGLGASHSDKGAEPPAVLHPPTILQPTISSSSLQRNSKPYEPSPRPEVREIGVQTDSPDSNRCLFCHKPLNPSTSTLSREYDFQSLPYIASSALPARDDHRDLKTSGDLQLMKGPGDSQLIKRSTDFRQITNDPNAPSIGPLSDGSKTDSFCGSDALPDHVERLFDRASFSIHGYDAEPISPLYTDPDCLQKNLRQFINERPSDMTEDATARSTAKHGNPRIPNVSPSTAVNSSPPKRSVDNHLLKGSSPPRPSSLSPTLTSISGVLFTDPFHSSIPRSTETASSMTKTRSPSRSDHSLRRKLSLPIPSQDVPPVPAIPDAFRKDHGQTALNVDGSSPASASMMSPVIRPHSPVQEATGYTGGSGRRFSNLSHYLAYVNGRRQSSRGSSGHSTTETYGSPPSEIPVARRPSQTGPNRLSQLPPSGPLSHTKSAHGTHAHCSRPARPFPVTDARTSSSSATALRCQGSPSASVSTSRHSSVALSSQIPRRSSLWNVIVRTKPTTVIPTSVIESNRVKSQAASRPRKLQRKKSSKVAP